MANNPELTFLATLWRTLTRVDKSRLNGIGLSLRNSVAVALPLGIGLATDHPLAAVAISSGALNVAYSDGTDPYAQRARRMLTWSVLGAFAAFLGSITGNYHPVAIAVAALWALMAGLLISISSKAGDLGLNTLVYLIVYAARGAMSPKGALYAGLLVLAGGILQTVVALLAWPFRRYEPERRVVGQVYLDLAREIGPRDSDNLTPPLNLPSTQVQETLAALGRDHSLEGERFRLLFDQVDRLRFSIYHVNRLRLELANEMRAGGAPTVAAEKLQQILTLSGRLLGELGQSLLSGDAASDQPEVKRQLREVMSEVQSHKKNSSSYLAAEFAAATDILAGQLRMVLQMASSAIEEKPEWSSELGLAPPWQLQIRSWLATLRANLDLRSAACRHSIRLAVCIAVGDAIGKSINTGRHYWLPMTIAVVLKPDFGSTVSRGVLRLCGTLAGLLIATVLFHAFPITALTQLLLIGVYTFFLRYLGPANYGVFSVAISGLIVFLVAATGVPPAEVVLQRAVNTGIGGVLALIAYMLWPTWERTTVTEAVAEMIDRSRDYFHAVVSRFAADNEVIRASLDETRGAWRRVRSNTEASVDRVAAEPGTSPARLQALTSILASSHAVVHAIMGLEAGVDQAVPKPIPGVLQAFSHDVEFTLYFLAAALRGSPSSSQTYPKLREDHRLLTEALNDTSAVDEYVLAETDRLVVSLNTLREQVLRCVD